jgi:hypothetical protein
MKCIHFNLKIWFIPFFLIILSPVVVFSQETMKELPDYVGHTVYKYEKYAEGYEFAQKFTPQEESLAKAKMESVSQYLQSYPLISAPKGVDVIITSKFSDNLTTENWFKSLQTEMTVILSPWYIKNGKPANDCSLCQVGFSLQFNHPEMAFYGLSSAGGGGVSDENGLVMYPEPEVIGEQNGCKLFDNRIVLITNGKPLWVPVTVKEYDEALIRKFEMESKEGTNEAFALKGLLKMVKDEMASFTSGELNQPAYQSDKMGGSPNKLEGSKAIVKLNIHYFDISKPKTAVQLIVLECGNITASESGDYYFTNEDSSMPDIKLAELLKSFRYGEFKKLLD